VPGVITVAGGAEQPTATLVAKAKRNQRLLISSPITILSLK